MRQRQSIRLKNYDYAQPGAYFITICTARRECLFGEIRDGSMRLNAVGELIAQTWSILPQRYRHLTLDAFVVMPNHVHGVICIGDAAGWRVANRGAASSAPTGRSPESLAGIIRAFKSLSAIAANRLIKRQGQPLWQRNYYERIIRNDDEWNRVREYIAFNPQRWAEDAENPSNRA